jgi:hypothetical protein
MTDMRDHLADIVEDAIDSVHDMDVTHRDYAEASADAIIAAMPWVQEAVKVLLDACNHREPMVAAYDDDVFLSTHDLDQFRETLNALAPGIAQGGE